MPTQQTPCATGATCTISQQNPAQIQASIDNMHWNERQQELQNAVNRDMQHRTADYQVRQQHIDHVHHMVDHLATPIGMVIVVAIIAYTLYLLVSKSIVSGEQRNRDDNESNERTNRDDNAAEVKYAAYLVEKHTEEKA